MMMMKIINVRTTINLFEDLFVTKYKKNGKKVNTMTVFVHRVDS